MSYSVTAVFKFASTRIALTEGEDITRVKFDTESTMLSDVLFDAAEEVMTQRIHNGRDYLAFPSHRIVTAYPTLSFKRR